MILFEKVFKSDKFVTRGARGRAVCISPSCGPDLPAGGAALCLGLIDTTLLPPPPSRHGVPAHTADCRLLGPRLGGIELAVAGQPLTAATDKAANRTCRSLEPAYRFQLKV